MVLWSRHFDLRADFSFKSNAAAVCGQVETHVWNVLSCLVGLATGCVDDGRAAGLGSLCWSFLQRQLMCPSHPEVNRLMSSLIHFTSQSSLILPSPSGRWYFLSDIHSVLIHGSFLEISLKYFVFISSVEICIYMFNKTRYDLLRPVCSSLSADAVSSLCFYCKSWRTVEKANKCDTFPLKWLKIEEGSGGSVKLSCWFSSDDER